MDKSGSELQEVVERAKRRDAAAINALAVIAKGKGQAAQDSFAVLLPIALVYCGKLIGKYRLPGCDISDTRQRASIIIWESLDRYDPELGAFLAFVYTTVARGLATIAKESLSQKRYVVAASIDNMEDFNESDATQPDPFEAAQTKEEARLVSERLTRILTPRQLAVFYRFFVEGESGKVIAEALGCSVSAVESVVLKIRNRLAGYGYAPTRCLADNEC